MYYPYRFTRGNVRLIHNGVVEKQFGIVNKFLINDLYSGYVLVNSSEQYEFHCSIELPDFIKVPYLNLITRLHKEGRVKEMKEKKNKDKLNKLFQDN
ncbi:hypothetical protein C3I27_03665 [Campylobacter jejuni]|uniref:Uncharacterized protein n=1 Tax=Campylobacter jejuni TaxID=197 RepID=A0AAX1Z4V3_CAMJU|nr:hypothetical protein C3I27_03665 [Campylobacter jejuni]